MTFLEKRANRFAARLMHVGKKSELLPIIRCEKKIKFGGANKARQNHGQLFQAIKHSF